MSQALTLARPYARAAFSIARDDGKFADWSAALGFAAHVASDPRVAGLLGNPKLGDADAVALLSPEGAQPLFGNFLALLADNRRLVLLPAIAGLYEELRADAERVVKARVTSATDLPAGELDARSEENTHDLQSLLRTSYPVFCLTTKTTHTQYLQQH